MARMNSAVRHGIDGLLQLSDGLTAATTAGDYASKVAGVATYLDLLALTEAYWDNQEIAAAEEFAIELNVLTADDGDADETYVFKVQVDNVNTFDDNPVTVLSYTHTRGTTGRRPLLVSRAMLQELDYEARYLRILVTTTGSTPSLTYTAWVAPVRN